MGFILESDSRRLIGVVTRSHLMKAYRQEMFKRAMVQERRTGVSRTEEDTIPPPHLF